MRFVQDATQAEIKKAFRRESIKWHPYKHAGDADATHRATIKFKQLNEANQTLSDLSKRLAYDRKLRYSAWDDDDYDLLGRYRRGYEGQASKETILQKHREREAELSN
eukprot:SAG31_NODE_26752_length_437_cov_0.763314_2_plen_107_part_01